MLNDLSAACELSHWCLIFVPWLHVHLYIVVFYDCTNILLQHLEV